ncbi:MAG TPA: lipocalin-like domain-containing protein [Anaerolineae bacterium]
MRRKQAWFGLILALVLAGSGWLALNARRTGPRPLAATLAEAAPAQTGAAGFARADGPKPLSFPADYGPHDDYQTEWWYYTGNLTTADGQHFGYQLTFFRRALLPPAERSPRAADWAAGQVYLAHLALTDVAGKHHYVYQRLERGAAGLAGATAQPYRVWLDSWSVSGAEDAPVHLAATEGALALQLDLVSQKAPVPQGDRGYSRKGPEAGNASYYYSLTHLATTGTVMVNGRAFNVQGLSWMDHEYSTSALSAGAAGWDWVSLQLSDGRDLMVFQIRRADGAPDPYAAGILVAADGSTQRLGPGDFVLRATGQWRSPRSGAVYPSGWTLSIRPVGLELILTPYLADQELDVGYTYWEGATEVTGRAGGATVTGSGYVELTGYAGSMAGQF